MRAGEAGLSGIALAVLLLGWLIAHIALATRLLGRGSTVRAIVALFIPPLAPFWGYQAGLRRNAVAWGAALALYTVLLVVVLARTE
jgi:hypothetical protein